MRALVRPERASRTARSARKTALFRARSSVPPASAPARELDLPESARDQRLARSPRGDAVDLEVGAADHHVEVDRRPVEAGRRAVTRTAEAGAECDVRCRVLAHQRVVVHALALSDAGRRVDERDLAEPAAVAARIAVDVGREELAIR